MSRRKKTPPANRSRKNRLKGVRGSSRNIRYVPTGKNGTANAGLVPVIKFVEEQLELVEEHVPHKRDINATYQLSHIMQLVIIGIIAGADNITQILNVWRDSVLIRVTGWLRIPDDTTIGRMIKELEQRHIDGMEKLVHAVRAKIWANARKAGCSHLIASGTQWIDVDSTVITVYGHQEEAKKGYNPHKPGAKSYNPLLAFWAGTKEIIQGELRPGNATNHGVLEFIQRLLSYFAYEVRIIIRADKGFYDGALMDLLEKFGHGFLIKAVLTQALIRILGPQKWTPVPNQPGWEQCEFYYKADNWSRARLFIAVRRIKEQKPKEGTADLQDDDELNEGPEYEYFAYVVTEDLDLTPWEGHKKYGERATSETWIDEAKNQMGLGHIRTGVFLANSALFQMGILAYNIMRWMALLSKTEIQRWEPVTIRRLLIQVVGKLLTGGRQLRLQVPSEHITPKEWQAWLALGSPG